jgi:hypothetical protein
MTQEQEIRAKALEIAVLLKGSSSDSPLAKYLPLASEIVSYIKTVPGDARAKGGSVGAAPLTGI